MTTPLDERQANAVSPASARFIASMVSLPLPVLLSTVALLTLTGTLISMDGLSNTVPGDSVAVGARLTARLTFVFFIAAYLARPLWQRFLWAPARWALRSRRWLGLAAALCHSVHLGYVVADQLGRGEAIDLTTLVFGGLGFVLFWLLGVTSSDSAVRALGRGWRTLHRFGIHYLWFIFLVTYAGAATLSPGLWLFVALLVGGAMLRVWNHLRPAPQAPTAAEVSDD